MAVLSVAVLAGSGGCHGDANSGPDPTDTPAGLTGDATQPAFYTDRVRPIFVRNCGKCHFGWQHRGGFAMDSKAAMMKGGKDGIVILPGDPDASRLMQALRHDPGPKPMPENRKLSDQQIETVRRWIEAGAVMPESPR